MTGGPARPVQPSPISSRDRAVPDTSEVDAFCGELRTDEPLRPFKGRVVAGTVARSHTVGEAQDPNTGALGRSLGVFRSFPTGRGRGCQSWRVSYTCSRSVCRSRRSSQASATATKTEKLAGQRLGPCHTNEGCGKDTTGHAEKSGGSLRWLPAPLPSRHPPAGQQQDQGGDHRRFHDRQSHPSVMRARATSPNYERAACGEGRRVVERAIPRAGRVLVGLLGGGTRPRLRSLRLSRGLLGARRWEVRPIVRLGAGVRQPSRCCSRVVAGMRRRPSGSDVCDGGWWCHPGLSAGLRADG